MDRIRDATLKDLEAVVQLCVAAEQIVLGPAMRTAVEQSFRTSWTDTIRRNRVRLLERDGELVGVSAARTTFVDLHRRGACIDSVYVDSRHWRQGVGTALFEDQLEWVRAQSAVHVVIYVDPSNIGAQNFWLAQGFVRQDGPGMLTGLLWRYVLPLS